MWCQVWCVRGNFNVVIFNYKNSTGGQLGFLGLVCHFSLGESVWSNLVWVLGFKLYFGCLI